MAVSSPELGRRISLGPVPTGRRMRTTDDGFASTSVAEIFDVVQDVERWPQHLPHYRWVRMIERDSNGGGIVEMSANRPFGALNWPTWWRSLMEVDHARPALRFRHIDGVTTGMDVDWAFTPTSDGTQITLLHVWNGPNWPLIGGVAATAVIGPVFVHGIASLTMRGLVRAAEARQQ